MQDRKYDLLIMLFLLASAVFHISTLTISPIVWTDEVFFNAVTMDWVANKTLNYTADYNWAPGQIYAYGPIYFWINGSILSVLGNSIFTARLLSLISAFALYIVVFLFVKKFSSLSGIWLVLLAGLFLTDPFFNAAAHWVRMDSLAILFYLLSVFIVLKQFGDNRNTYWSWIFSGLLMAASILTTPRMIMLSGAVMAIGLYYLWLTSFSLKSIFRVLLWGAIPIGLYALWVLIIFGSIDSYILYFQGVQKNLYNYVARGFYVPTEVWPLMIIGLVVLFAGIYVAGKRFLSPIVVFCTAFMINFYIAVRDTGPYSTLIIPVYYILLGISLSIFVTRARLVLIGVYLLLAFNVSLFMLKGVTLYVASDSRQYEPVEQFIKSNIPRGSKVAGDEVYYYAAVRNDYPFHMLFSYQANYPQTAHYTLNTFDYDYLVMSEKFKKANPDLVPLYLQQPIQRVASYKTQHPEWLSKLHALGLYGAAFTAYDGVIYKRIR